MTKCVSDRTCIESAAVVFLSLLQFFVRFRISKIHNAFRFYLMHSHRRQLLQSNSDGSYCCPWIWVFFFFRIEGVGIFTTAFSPEFQHSSCFIWFHFRNTIQNMRRSHIFVTPELNTYTGWAGWKCIKIVQEKCVRTITMLISSRLLFGRIAQTAFDLAFSLDRIELNRAHRFLTLESTLRLRKALRTIVHNTSYLFNTTKAIPQLHKTSMEQNGMNWMKFQLNESYCWGMPPIGINFLKK